MKVMKGAIKAFLMVVGGIIILLGLVLIALTNEEYSTMQMLGTKLSGVVLVGIGMFMGFDDHFKKQQERRNKRNKIVGE